MPNFITNAEGKDLKKRLIELVENSRELKFLVGFFYFSGIRELYEGLKNNPNASQAMRQWPHLHLRPVKRDLINDSSSSVFNT